MSESSVARRVLVLKAYAVCITLAWVLVVVHNLSAQSERTRFTEIDVERINIVEADGQLRMVIANQERQHPGIRNGQLIPRPQGRPPGVIFFDHRGEEMGGLIFGDNGGNGHFGQFTWDKVEGDQAMAFRLLESHDGAYQSGIEMWQRPEGAARLFLGKRRDDTAALELFDVEGNPRVRLRVGPDGTPALELLDAEGRVTRSIQ